jgi:hypothetical protein
VWTRSIAGLVLCVLGVVWLAQGAGVLHGSRMMSGHGQFAVLGGAVFLVGAALLLWAARIRRRMG